MTILAWCNRFVETGCLPHMEPDQTRPCVADETIENVQQTFIVRSPRKSSSQFGGELCHNYSVEDFEETVVITL